MRLYAILFLALYCFSASAQILRCTTDEYFEELKTLDSSLEQHVEQSRLAVRHYLTEHRASKQQPTLITVPVVVHVMHNGEAVGTGKNISDEQIESQITVLNEDYQALNSDLDDVPSHFEDRIGDVEIEFCLASYDPDSNLTNGIDRINMGSTGTWNDGRKPGSIWNPDHYLNIWVVDMSGSTLGYATYPGTQPNRDGVVIDYLYFGRTPENPFNNEFNLGRTTTHEVGHWLGLEHTFEGGCAGTTAATCASEGDRICDTPPTSGANYGCSLPTNRNTCQETPDDFPDMWMNYMDYMDDACLFMFTREQADEMRAVLSTTRSGILESPACDLSLFTYTGKVINAETGAGAPGARVAFVNDVYTYESTTNQAGNFSAPAFKEGSYAIYAGKWGYMTKEFTPNMMISDTAAPIIIPIDSGYYYDDFVLDLGWTTSGDATTGRWTRGVPRGTTFDTLQANPGADVAGDLGNKCFVTGNGGGAVGDDDVDDGSTILTSPLFDLTGFKIPYLSYYKWFFNAGGQNAPNDKLVISLTNGSDTVILETTDSIWDEWQFSNFQISDLITPSANMQLILETSDSPDSGNIVEAALDQFSVVDSFKEPPKLLDFEDNIFVYYGPDNEPALKFELNEAQNFKVKIISISGQVIDEFGLANMERDEYNLPVAPYASGIYLVQLRSIYNSLTRKILVSH